jgi:hypothetical protein
VAVLSGLPPRALKQVFEQNGYELVGDDEFNWMLALPGDVPLIIPKLGHVVSVPVMEAATDHARRRGLLRALMQAVAEYVRHDND